ncbi:UDP-glucose 4-epimerase GalE [Crocinitomix algicola]|uniref:UDP-glucose 4-epimerase GalE n=1 Tax=Crocinitomix algicola TaxID=1740263 RepID=UPI00082D0D21|nr:UDP-glucose 4-epimerase GalE [Crocinitomix algicola]
MTKTVIVTGGAGYIGSHTVVELYNAGYNPVIIDDFRNSKPWIIDRIESICGGKIPFFNVDCQDELAVKKVVENYTNVHGLIHFAADKAVGESVAKPVQYYQNNVGSLCAILNVMQSCNIENLVFSSSCTVYGEAADPAVTEETPIKEAASPYGDTKITCEKIIQFATKGEGQLKSTLLRYFNPIGAHPSAKIGELPQGVPNNLMPYITQTAKGIREKLTVFGNDYDTPDGTNIRDYIHVVDLAIAHVKALEFLDTAANNSAEPFNLGTGRGSSVLEMIRAFETENNLKLNYVIGPRRAGDVPMIYANPKKAQDVLGWTCKYTVSDAVKHAWNWEQSLGN